MPAATGAHTRLTYLWEDAGFGNSPSDTTYKTFGREPTLDTLEGSNQAVRMFEPGSREAQEIIEQAFEGSFTVSFTLSNPWWIQSVIAEPTTSGTDQFTHTFDGQWPSSMQIVQAVENVDEERTLEGCVVTSATIDTSVPDVVTVSLDGAYANESVGSVTQEQVAPAMDAYQFDEASIQLDANNQRRIQNASLTIENNTDIIYEIGSRFGVDYSPKARNPNIDFTEIVNDENNSRVERMYGSSAATEPQSTVDVPEDVVFRFERENTSNYIQFDIGGSFPDTYSVDGTGDPTVDLEAELSEMAETVTAEASNGESEAL